MKKSLFLFAASLAVLSCSESKTDNGKTDPVTEFSVPAYAKGADISWCTEMESKGRNFYTSDGTKTECTALMQKIGCNAIRLRVWVNPSDGWCGKEDVIVKATRAQALGMAIMIDFHYSDSWADPSKQTIPAAWASYGVDEMAQAVSDHTTEVLQALKDAGVSNVCWVQVGNETNTGMLWTLGSVSTANKGANFIKFANAGYDAVKAVYPNALVILHHSNAQELAKNQWFYDIMKTGGAKYDMIGLSLYPSYWSDSLGGYPDWTTYTYSAVSNVKTLHERYNLPVMLVEFGMPQSEPQKAKAALQYVLDNTKSLSWFKGVFYWEPESEPSRNGYAYGAFSAGRPTIALEPFAQ